ncbi:MAG TPA: dephospho-CoA kinase [Phycisphaerae bacterium]|nr:dephospho-CoA kinase [Phycisphaerae bacterium]HPS53947.1 dephospho-CoA kinase [Phycisphaerae bacterium]
MNDSVKSVPVIGLVGGVGSGKSAAADIFRSLGCEVIDADAVGHEVLQLPQVAAELGKIFGRQIFDAENRISRPALAKKVFGCRNAENLHRLEAVVHPVMWERFMAAIRDAANKGVIAVVLDAAVLFEAGWDSLCSCTIFVDSAADVRRRRVLQTRGWDENKWRQRENSQFSLDKKAAQCCYKLYNDSDIPHLKLQVKSLLDQITGN